MQETQAIILLKKGDPAGLAALVKLHQVKALRTAALITGDPHTAEDIVQNAFLRAAEKIHQFDEKRRFGPWFYRIVANDAIKAARKQNRHTSLDGQNHHDQTYLTDPAPLPQEQIEQMESKQAVWDALEALPPTQRAAVVMHYYLGMKEEEIAQEMNSPAGTTKWRLHTARKRLKSLLQEPVERKR